MKKHLQPDKIENYSEFPRCLGKIEILKRQVQKNIMCILHVYSKSIRGQILRLCIHRFKTFTKPYLTMSEAFFKPTKTTIFIFMLLLATCAMAQDGTIYPLEAP
ncbi:MAG: hypothetical protein NTX25_21200, partial [Proteobacteria bacterium]|nr:hypothetical protein [Pseudomonadota bacterium]